MAVHDRRTGSAEALGRETGDVAQSIIAASAVAGGASGASRMGAMLTGLASAVALIFSAISLYHSVLKQPELKLHLPEVVHYTRDPNGNYEVFAVPLTIANVGARDGTVLGLELAVSAVEDGTGAGGESGETGGATPAAKVFYAAYSVDGQFFVPPGRFNQQERGFERVDRPKTPFAPAQVPGRGSYSGTLLFYTKAGAFPKIISDKGRYLLRLSANAQLDASLGWFDRLVASPPQDVMLTVRLPYFSESELLRGGTHRLTSAAWPGAEAKGEAQAQ